MSKAMIINSTNTAGTATSTAITNVNPNATNGELIALAQGLNGLTKNTYRGATLVEKTELVAKPEPPVRLSASTFTIAQIQSTTEDTIAEFRTQSGNGNYQFALDNMPRVVSNNTPFMTRVVQMRYTDDNDKWTGVYIGTDKNANTFDPTTGGEPRECYDQSGQLIGSQSQSGEIVVEVPETTQYAAKTFTITITA